MRDDVLGAVLAGGRSRRMGVDKASLEVGGRTLVRLAVDALRATGLDVALVLRAEQPVPRTADTVDVVRDAVQNAGPLGGLHALLGWLQLEWVLVVPCDQPFLAPNLLGELLAQPRDGVDVIIGQPNELVEPLPGLYRRACRPAVQQALDRGCCSLQDLLSVLRVRQVPVAALRPEDAQLLSYVNVNTPADLERARSLAADLD